jgi:hypothetical protein
MTENSTVLNELKSDVAEDDHGNDEFVHTDTKCCTTCNEVKPFESFHKAARGKGGRRSICKSCGHISDNLRNEKKMQDSKHFVAQMVRINKQHDQKARRECDLTEEYIFELYEKQGGLCAVTSAPIYLRRDTWQASPERQDNSLGHLKTNTVLVALMCNHKFQWTREKFKMLLAKREEAVDFEAVVH